MHIYCTSRFYSCLSQNPPPRFLLYQLVFPKRTQQPLYERPIRLSIFRLPSHLLSKIRETRSWHLCHSCKKLGFILLPRIFGSVTFRSRDFSSRYGPKQSSLAVLELIGLTYFEAEWDGGKVNSTKLALPVKFRYGVHPDITHSGDYVFRGVHLGPPQGRAAAKFLSDNLGLKRVSIVTMDNDYGQATFEGFKSAVDQFGIKVLGEYSYSLKDRQFGSIVASVKRDNPDVIYITGYFFTAAPLVTQLRSAGIRAPIVGSQAFDAEKFIQIAGAAVEGVYIVGGLNRDRDSPELKEYLTEFQKRAGYAGENVGASVYSAVRLMCDAITRATNCAIVARFRTARAARDQFGIFT